MFSKKDLQKLIIPLIVEQILAVTVGMTDTIMVSIRGEAAVSGVSLVDSINVLLIGLFSALATGGAVVAAQYLGHKEKDKASEAANQLILAVATVAIGIMLTAILLNKQILYLIYRKLDADVMSNARKYFYIIALSYPFIAVYNAGAALFRAMNNSKISMNVSLCMNLINIAGNAFLLFVMHFGVEGSAIATLIARIIGATYIILKLRNQTYDIHISKKFSFKFNSQMVKRILRIGIPNGLENSIFQFGKIIVASMIAGLGTAAVTANAVANTVSSLEVIPGSAMGLAMITVVGQCVGANDLEQTKKYTWKLLRYAYLFLIALNFCVILLLNPIVSLYQLSDSTAVIAKQLMLYHSIFCMIIWPSSFTLPNALRAANDVKFTMYVSIISMWIWRIAFSYFLVEVVKIGVIGVWIAMTIDWAFRATLFLTRFRRGGWIKYAFGEKFAKEHVKRKKAIPTV